MKKLTNFKKMILPIIFLPCLFIFAPLQNNTLKTNYSNTQPTPTSTSSLKQAPFQDSIKQIESGDNHNGAIVTDENGDHLYTWGDNSKGQLGLGYEGNPSVDGVNYYTTPQEVTGLPDDCEIEEIYMAGNMSAALIIDPFAGEQLWMWGDNSCGQLGNGEDQVSKNEPTKTINLPDQKNDDIELVAVGGTHSAAVVYDESAKKQKLYMWGSSDHGQLGFYNEIKEIISTPKYVNSEWENDNIEQISLGENHSAFVTRDSENKQHLFMFGDNSFGQLGYECSYLSTEIPNISYNYNPKEIEIEPNSTINIKEISMGANYSAAVVNDDTGDYLYTWGDNSRGQLGLGEKGLDFSKQNGFVEIFNSPQLVADLPKGDIKQIATSSIHSAVIVEKNDGRDHLYTWGNNETQQLGRPDDDKLSISFPEEASFPINSGVNTQQVSLGVFHTIVLNKEGNNDLIYAAGNNDNGQLGNGTHNSSTNFKFEETWGTQYFSNIKTSIISNKESNYETATFNYEFETNVNPEITVNVFNLGTTEIVSTTSFEPNPVADSEYYSGIETLEGFEKNTTYNYEVIINYPGYDDKDVEIKSIYGIFKSPYWYQNVWFFTLIGVVILFVIFLILLLFYLNWKNKRKIS